MQVLVLTQVLCAILLAGAFEVYTKVNAVTKHAKRIIGGSVTAEGEFPFVVYLRIRKYIKKSNDILPSFGTGYFWMPSIPLKMESWMCAGSIITEYHVVTAAHCVYTKAEEISEQFRVRAENVQALVGLHELNDMFYDPLRNGVQTIPVAEIHRHPLYQPAYQTNDIALLTLAWPTGAHNIKVCLPPEGLIWDERGMQVTTLGWGAESIGGEISQFLKKLHSIVVNNPGVFLYTGTSIGTANTGDSGGPVLLESLGGLPTLVGIVSGPAPTFGGVSLEHTVGQGAIYRNTRVAPFTSWIRQEISSNQPLASWEICSWQPWY